MKRHLRASMALLLAAVLALALFPAAQAAGTELWRWTASELAADQAALVSNLTAKSGTAVRWTYGHELSTIHAYFDPHWYRIAYPREGLKSKSQKATNSLFRECLAMLPGSEEPAYYVKIKEGMYLVSVTEQNMEKIVAEKFGFRSDTLCFLDNWNRLTSVGRGYGTRTDKDGHNSELFLMIGKYGSPVDVDPKYMEDPIAYIV